MLKQLYNIFLIFFFYFQEVYRKIDLIVLSYICVFDNLILADELFAASLRSCKTFLLVSKVLCWKLVSSLESPIILEESFRVTSVAIFVAGFNLLNCKLDKFNFDNLNCYIESLYIDITSKQNKFTILSWLPVKNQKQFLLLLQ